MKISLKPLLLLAAALAFAPAAHAQITPDCATRTGFTEDLATRRDDKQAQAQAVEATVKVVNGNVEIPAAYRQVLVAVINDAAQLAWSLPQLAPADVALVQRMACREGNLTGARIATLAAAAEACAREAAAQGAPAPVAGAAAAAPGAPAAGATAPAAPAPAPPPRASASGARTQCIALKVPGAGVGR